MKKLLKQQKAAKQLSNIVIACNDTQSHNRGVMTTMRLRNKSAMTRKGLTIIERIAVPFRHSAMTEHVNNYSTIQLLNHSTAKRLAFTLAEILITVAIIGVVAVMAIPTLVSNVNNKQYIIATSNFNSNFGEALKVMNSQGVLAERRTTQGFLDELEKVFKVLKVCDNTELDQCFPKEIIWGNKTVDVTSLKKSFNIVSDNFDWGTDVMGVRFANGVSGLIAYNPTCKQDQYNNNLIQVGGDKNSVGFSTNNCIAMLYDINTNKKPNKVGVDISKTSNVENLGEIININGIKLTKITKAGDFDFIDCTDTSSNDYAKYCENSKIYPKDYWAGAAKVCGGKNNMISEEELAKIAQYLYDNNEISASYPISTSQYVNTASSTRLTEFKNYGFPDLPFGIWSSRGEGSYYSYVRKFEKSSTMRYYNSGRSDSWPMAVCVKH